VGIRDVRTVAVERWLKQLRRVNGERLADATKAKIRNLMSVLFNHAIRYEWQTGEKPDNSCPSKRPTKMDSGDPGTA